MQTGQTPLTFVDESIMKKIFPFRENRMEEAPRLEITFRAQNAKKDFEHAVKSGALSVEKSSKNT